MILLVIIITITNMNPKYHIVMKNVLIPQVKKPRIGIPMNGNQIMTMTMTIFITVKEKHPITLNIVPLIVPPPPLQLLLPLLQLLLPLLQLLLPLLQLLLPLLHATIK
jgi:hypothetical protein